MSQPAPPAVDGKQQPRPEPLVANPLDALLRFESAEPQGRLSLLLYGKSGVGKTSLAGTAQDDQRSNPVLIVDTERGYESIAYRIPAKEDLDRDHSLRVMRLANFRDGMNALRRYFYPPQGQEPTIKFKTIVLDSVSETGYLAMQGINPGEVQEIKDWQHYDAQLRQMISFLRDLPAHLIVIAAEKEDEEGGTIGPAIRGGIRENLPGFFNTVARLTTSTVADPSKPGQQMIARKLTLQSAGKVVAKDRMDKLGTLGNTMDAPTVGKLLDRMEQSRNQAKQLRIERAQKG